MNPDRSTTSHIQPSCEGWVAQDPSSRVVKEFIFLVLDPIHINGRVSGAQSVQCCKVSVVINPYLESKNGSQQRRNIVLTRGSVNNERGCVEGSVSMPAFYPSYHRKTYHVNGALLCLEPS